MIEERRIERRRAVLKGARIVFNGGHSAVGCVVKNMSGSGARLKLDNAAGIPSRFLLRFDDAGVPARECVVHWRALDALGVEFVTPDSRD